MSELRAESSEPGQIAISRPQAIEAYVAGLDIAVNRALWTPPTHYHYQDLMLGAFHINLIREAAMLSGGPLYACLRDNHEDEKDTPPYIQMENKLPDGEKQKFPLFYPIEHALEAVQLENLGVSHDLAEISGSGNQNRIDELRGMGKILTRQQRILTACSAPAPLPEKKSPAWESMIAYMAERFHYSPAHRLMTKGLSIDQDDAKRDWFKMTTLARGNVFNPPAIQDAKMISA